MAASSTVSTKSEEEKSAICYGGNRLLSNSSYAARIKAIAAAAMAIASCGWILTLICLDLTTETLPWCLCLLATVFFALLHCLKGLNDARTLAINYAGRDAQYDNRYRAGLT